MIALDHLPAVTTCSRCGHLGVLDVQTTVDSYGTRARYTCSTGNPACRDWWIPQAEATKPASPVPQRRGKHGLNYCWRCKRNGSHTLRCMEIQASRRPYRRKVTT